MCDLRCLYWCGLLVLGFAYVAMFLCGRPLPFASGNNPWGDWLGVLLSAPTLYLLAARHTLREPGPSLARAVLWNGPVYAGSFFAALHWEWAGKITHANFSLTVDQLSRLDLRGKIAGAVGLAVFAAMAGLCLREARREGILGSYLLSFAGLASIVAGVTWALGRDYHLHVHHYFLALGLLPFVRFRHPACLVTQAILTGVYVEGACRWGLDPVWIAGR